MYLTLALGAFLIALYFWLLRPPKRLRELVDKIPGPKSYPVVGNALEIKSGHAWFVQLLDMASQNRTEGIFRLWLANKPMAGIFKPEYIEALLNNSKHIEKSDQYDFVHAWLGTGLLTSAGDKWRHRRKMLTPAFHFNILHDFVHVFNKQSHVLVEKLTKKSSEGQFDVFQDITHCALDIICETAMGKSIDAQSSDSEYVKAVYRMSFYLDARMRKPWYWSDFLYNIFGYGKEQAQTLQILHDFTKSVIEDRMKNFDATKADIFLKQLENESASDKIGSKNKRLVFLDLLLYMSENLTKLSMKDIREEVDTFMFEGHDTTAAAMSWAIHLLGANPEAQAKLHEEMASIFGNDDRDPTMQDLKNMKYLECCIKEALRLFPSVPMYARRLSQDLQLGQYLIPKGMDVIVVPPAVHRDPAIFPDPEDFIPERFSQECCRQRHPFSYVPFSAGSRNCIGQKFALLEEKTVLSHIFRKFHVNSVQSRSELRPVGDIILRPEKNIMIELTPLLSLK